MTIFTRGYRRFEGTLSARRFRWAPIAREGYREAASGGGYWVLLMLIGVLWVVFAFMIYLNAPGLTDNFLERGGRHSFDPSNLDPTVLAKQNLEGAILLFDWWTYLLVMFLTLFKGAGLIADDLKARALPLYLVRPITPFDYYLGKLLILVRILAIAVLLPMLSLVLIAALLRPSEEMWDFLVSEGRLIGAILLYYVCVALTYASLAILFSAMTARRITSIVLGAVVFLGGTMLRGVVQRGDGSVAKVARAASLSGDTSAILWSVVGREVPRHNFPIFAPPGHAIAAMAAVVLAAAVVVLRRARTVEVVS